MKFPSKPSIADEWMAIFCEEVGLVRPPQVMTEREWKREVCLYWMERMAGYMAEALNKNEKD